jgi:hypothetical protein
VHLVMSEVKVQRLSSQVFAQDVKAQETRTVMASAGADVRTAPESGGPKALLDCSRSFKHTRHPQRKGPKK